MERELSYYRMLSAVRVNWCRSTNILCCCECGQVVSDYKEKIKCERVGVMDEERKEGNVCWLRLARPLAVLAVSVLLCTEKWKWHLANIPHLSICFISLSVTDWVPLSHSVVPACANTHKTLEFPLFPLGLASPFIKILYLFTWSNAKSHLLCIFKEVCWSVPAVSNISRSVNDSL